MMCARAIQSHQSRRISPSPAAAVIPRQRNTRVEQTRQWHGTGNAPNMARRGASFIRRWAMPGHLLSGWRGTSCPRFHADQQLRILPRAADVAEGDGLHVSHPRYPGLRKEGAVTLRIPEGHPHAVQVLRAAAARRQLLIQLCQDLRQRTLMLSSPQAWRAHKHYVSAGEQAPR